MKNIKNLIVATIIIILSVFTGCKKPSDFNRGWEKEYSEGNTVISQFVHPGILFNSEDMARIKTQANSGLEPWGAGYDLLRTNSDKNYIVKGPFSVVERTDGANSTAANALTNDSQMAYKNAVMWFITNDIAYANKSIEIINAWSGTLTSLTGGDDMLMAAWYGFNLVNAAEILRYTDSGWQQADIIRAEAMFRNVFYELIKNWKRGRAGNWDTNITKTYMAIGIFLNDADIFSRAVRFYNSTTENSNGTLNKNVYPSGQNFESGRDQTHAQFGLGGLAETCEIAWKQGVDLYGAMENRLLKGYEYTAKYNLGESVPYENNVYGNSINATGRGNFQPIFEMVYNHYAHRTNVPAEQYSYTKAVVDKVRDERRAESGNAQHPGYGSLLFNLAPEVPLVSFIIKDGDFTVRTTKSKFLSIIKTPLNATGSALVWTSENPNIATVDNNGLVTGVAVGETYIKAATGDGLIFSRVKATVEENPIITHFLPVSFNAVVQGGTSQNNIISAASELLVKIDQTNAQSINNNRQTYLKLDFTNITYTPTSVILRVTSTTGTQNAILTARASNDTSWDPATLKWSNKPALLEDVIVSGVVVESAVEKEYELDISSYILPKLSTKKVFTIALVGQLGNTGLARLHSLGVADESKRPTIILTQDE